MSGYPQIRFGDDDKDVIYRNTDNNEDLVFQVNNDNVVTFSNLQNQDNMILGTTEPILVINDLQSDSSNAHSILRLSNELPEYWDIAAGVTGQTDNFSLHIGKDGNNDYFTITPSGWVGIGVTNPTQHLHVTNNALIQGGNLYLVDDERIESDGSNLRVHVQGVERLSILANGYLGIGITTPTQKLDVDGDILARGGDLFLVDTNNAINSTNDTMTFTTNGVARTIIDSDGQLTTYKDLGVSGNTYIQGNTEITGNTVMTGTLNVDSNVDIDAELDVLNNVVFQSDLGVSGTADIQTLNVLGNTVLTGTLDVDGDVDIDAKLDVLDDGVFQSNIGVSQHSYLNTVSANDLTLGSMTVQDITVTRDLGVSGLTYLNNAVITNNLGIGVSNPTEQLTVANDVLIKGGNLYLEDNTYSIGITNNRLTFNTNGEPQMYIEQDGSVVIGLTYPENTTERFYVDGDAQILGDLDVTGNISLQAFDGGTIQIGTSSGDIPIQIGAGDVTVHVPGDLNIGGDIYFAESNKIGFVNTNAADVTDFGVYGKFVGVSGTRYSGIARNAASKIWTFFQQDSDPDNPLIFDNNWDFEDFAAGKLGINTLTPEVSLSISGTDAIILPVGDDSERPSNPTPGMVRYNSSSNRLEIYDGALSVWSSIVSGGGQVADDDGDTYVIAETSFQADNDDLQFVTAGTERMRIDDTGKIGIGITQNALTTLEIRGTDAILIPKGTTAQRPNAEDGLFRFNTQQNRFEGYSNGNWSGIGGGAIDLDQDTYIQSETGPGNDEDTIQFFTNGSERMRIGITGQIGIGTDDPYVKLDINGTDAIRIPVGNNAARPTGQDGMIRYNSEQSTYEGFGSGAWGSLGGVKDVDQDTYISAETSAGADNDELRFFTQGSERLRIDSSGNVGVGTDSPQSNFHFHNNSGDGILQITNNTVGATATDGLQLRMNGGGIAKLVNQETSGDIAFETGGSEQMRISSSGSVGIGTNSPLGDTGDLHLYNASGGNTLIITAGTSSGANIDFGDTGDLNAGNIQYNNSDNSFRFTTNASEKVRILSDGKVGIGTTNPSTDLHVYNSSASNGAMLEATGASNITRLFLKNDARTWEVGTRGSSRSNVPEGFYIWDSTNGFRIVADQNGNVGIGTTDPQSLFHVYTGGDVQVDDNVGIGVTTANIYPLEIRKTSAMLVPKGTTAQRPGAEVGLIRYNTDQSRFEGYSNGSWSGIGGGAIDLDQDTYIQAETGPGNDEDTLQFFTDGSERMRINETGLVGIGVTQDALTSFEVRATDAILLPKGTTAERPNAEVGLIRYNTTQSRFEGYSNGTWSGIGGGAIDIDQDTYISAEDNPNDDNDQLRFYTQGSERMRIESNGDTKIFTNLGVTGTIYTQDVLPGTDSTYDLGTTGARYKDLYLSGTSINLGGSVISNVADSLELFTNGTEKVRVDSSGNVGIGTDNPSSKLYVQGDKIITSSNGTRDVAISNGTGAQLWLETEDNSNTLTKRLVISGNSNTPSYIWFQGASGSETESMILTGNGELGIGTNAPSKTLDVNGDVLVQGGDISLVDDNIQIGVSSNSLTFTTGGEQRMYIEQDGSVVIGATSSNVTEQLYVDGDVRIDGNLDLQAPETGTINIGTEASESTIQIGNDEVTLYVPGDLVVQGNTFYESNFIQVHRANLVDTEDSGWYTQYVDGGVTKYTGIARDATDGKWKVFDNHTDAPTDTLIRDGDWTLGGLTIGDLGVSGTFTVSGETTFTGDIGTSGAISFQTTDTETGIQIGTSNAAPVQIGNDEVTVYIPGDLVLQGNMYMENNFFGFNRFAADDSEDFGVFGHYIEGGVTKASGFVRDQDKDAWVLFNDHTDIPDVGATIIREGDYDLGGMFAGSVGIGTQDHTTNEFGNPEKLSVIGDVGITGHLLPGGDEVYDLGTTGRKWRDLYLSGDTIILGDATLTATGTKINLPEITVSGDLEITGDSSIGPTNTKISFNKNDGTVYNNNMNLFAATSMNMVFDSINNGNDLFRITKGTSTDADIDTAFDSNPFFMINNTGRIGIGTNNPGYLLDINGTSAMRVPKGTTAQRPTATDALFRYNTTLTQFEGYSNGSWSPIGGGAADLDGDTYIQAETSVGADNDDLQFFTAGTERMIIDETGKIGIGTTNPNWLLHSHKSDSTANYLQFTNSSTGTGILNGFVVGIDANERALLYNGSNTDMTFTTNSVERMRIFSNGSVGIGTNVAGHKLEVEGGNIMINTNDNFLGWGDESTKIQGNSSSDYLRFFTANTEAVRINSSGNVGIGTNNPLTSLHVSHDGATSSYGAGERGMLLTGDAVDEAKCRFYFENPASTSGSRVGFIAMEDEGLKFATLSDTAGAFNKEYALFIQGSNGNVGIGTSVPAYQFSLYNSAATWLHITNGTTGTTSGDGALIGFSNGTDVLQIRNRENSGIDFRTNDAERMRIDEDGNVGIGTTLPKGLFAVTNGGTGTSQTHFFTKTITSTANYYAELCSINGSYAHTIYMTISMSASGIASTATYTIPITYNTTGTGNWKLVVPTHFIESRNEFFQLLIETVNDTSTFRIRYVSGATATANITMRIDGYSPLTVTDLTGTGTDATVYDTYNGTQITTKANETTTNNVGIGTTDPQQALHIASDESNAFLYIQNTATHAAGNSAGISLGYTYTDAGGVLNQAAQIRVEDPDSAQSINPELIFELQESGIGADEKMRLVGGGSGVAKLGIGRDPATPLHIYENTTSTDNTAGLTIENNGTGDALCQFLLTSTTRWVMGIDNSDVDKFKIANSIDLDSDAYFTIRTNGFVGIGTVTPNQQLEINGSSEQVLGVYNTAGGTDNSYIYIGDSTDRFRIGYAEDNAFESNSTLSEIHVDTTGDIKYSVRSNNGNRGHRWYTPSGTTPTERMNLVTNLTLSGGGGYYMSGNVNGIFQNNSGNAQLIATNAIVLLRPHGQANTDQVEINPAGYTDFYYGTSIKNRIHGGGASFFGYGNVGIGITTIGTNEHIGLYHNAGTPRGNIACGIYSHVYHSGSGYPNADNVNSLFTTRAGSISAIQVGTQSGYANGSHTVGARIEGDGDMYNTNGTYGTISDERIKRNIVDANSQWNDIKELRFINYQLRETMTEKELKESLTEEEKEDDVEYQSDRTLLGLVAQEVEVNSPGLIKVGGSRELSDGTVVEDIKAIRYSVLYMKAVKALQEQMNKWDDMMDKLTNANTFEEFKSSMLN